MRDKIFISYSHVDSEALLRLKTHMKPFEREDKIEVWVDSKLKTGQLWKQEIRKALDRTAIAILLVSADFLASDFIQENELPPLLKACENEGVKILPVILKPCAFSDIEELSCFQSINDPRLPISIMNETKREELWYNLAKAAKDSIEEFEQEHDADLSEKEEVPLEYSDIFSPYSLYEIKMFMESELKYPETIDNYFTYRYQFVDILEFMPIAEKILKPIEGYSTLIDRVSENFKNYGWEGDGTIRLLWFPPFVGAGMEDTWGTLCFFVKQSNNGESFICSPVPLPFTRLLEQQ